MELQHLIAKFFTVGDSKLDPAQVVNLMHRWVAKQSMPEMLVDVAELLHVPKGPGVIAVGNDADYALDHPTAAGAYSIAESPRSPAPTPTGWSRPCAPPPPPRN